MDADCFFCCIGSSSCVLVKWLLIVCASDVTIDVCVLSLKWKLMYFNFAVETDFVWSCSGCWLCVLFHLKLVLYVSTVDADFVCFIIGIWCYISPLWMLSLFSFCCPFLLIVQSAVDIEFPVLLLWKLNFHAVEDIFCPFKMHSCDRTLKAGFACFFFEYSYFDILQWNSLFVPWRTFDPKDSVIKVVHLLLIVSLCSLSQLRTRAYCRTLAHIRKSAYFRANFVDPGTKPGVRVVLPLFQP